MFADKSSSPDPLSYLHVFFPSPLSSPADSSPFPLASSGHPALNNKYERVLREYPEGAISGVQARALGLTLAHTSKPTPGTPTSPVVFGFSHDSKRESNTLRDETRGALWKKGEGPSDRFMETAAFLSSLCFFFFSPFLNSSGGRRTNDWLEIYEKDRKIIPLAGDSKREELGGGDSNVCDINGGCFPYLARCKLPCLYTGLHTSIEELMMSIKRPNKRCKNKFHAIKTYCSCDDCSYR